MIDCETKTKNKGSVYTHENKLCLVGTFGSHGYECYSIEYDDSPYGGSLLVLRRRIEEADLLILFNAKFDLSWLRRYVPDISFPPIFDCQLAEFILSDQTEPYPSLDGCCERYVLGSKLDTVEREYWSLGIDTPQIPKEVLEPYLEQDVRLTYELFKAQCIELNKDKKKKRLFWLQCQDLLILQEMEWNGLRYDYAKAEELGSHCRVQIEEIDSQLCELAGTPDIDLASSDHLSCLLYGGTIQVKYREEYERILKDGTVRQRSRWSSRPYSFIQQTRPVENSEVKPTSEMDDVSLRETNRKREELHLNPFVRHWSVAEPVLRRTNAKGKAKKIIDLILRRAYLGKLDSTYYTGLIAKKEAYGWQGDELHGNFNQCVARTGRLSSSDPNLQNFSGEIKGLFYSRFD